MAKWSIQLQPGHTTIEELPDVPKVGDLVSVSELPGTVWAVTEVDADARTAKVEFASGPLPALPTDFD